MPVPTIVVIGGSFAGVGVIKLLDSTLKDKANIVLIEERDSFYQNLAALRSITEPNLAQSVWIPYTHLFQFNKTSRVVQARAVKLTPTAIELSTGESIPFDYAVVATGSNVPSPGKSTQTEKTKGVHEAQQILEALKVAKSVAIVGGGVVGVELAGEIKTDYPGVKVTLLHASASILNRAHASATALKMASKQLAGLGVEVRVGERVVKGQDGNILPGGVGYNLSPITLRTEKGLEVQSDVQFVVTGITGPNSDLVVRGLGAEAVDSNGYVLVGETGQLKGHNNLFALGDVSTLDNAKLAWFAGQQAGIVGANLTLLVEGSGATLKGYKPSTPGAFLAISIGRNGGVLQTPIGTFGPWLPKTLKSKDLGVPKYWGLLNLEFKTTTPK
ncbi:hypothetical protein BC830DRAFT_1224398 [Chytriomyces sp. MP71]|nr:hypothetical protein BC830DRAFT_1224398 [Chytriomyces sp. MP71]